MVYNIQYDMAALLLTIAVALYFRFRKKIPSRQNKLFAWIIVFALISNILDIVSVHTISFPHAVPLWVNYTINALYLISFNGVAVVYLLYAIFVTNDGKLTTLDHVRIFVPYLVCCILIMTTAQSRLIFYFDESLDYYHGPLMLLLYICALYYIISAFIQTIVYRKKLKREQITAVSIFTSAVIISIVLQLMVPKLLVVQYAVALTVFLILMSLENPDDYRDKMMNTYNNLAFMEVFENHVKREKKFTVLGIQVNGLKYINENLGVTAGNALMKRVADMLKEYAGEDNVYHMSGAQFVILSSSQELDWKGLIDKIDVRFKKPFNHGTMEIALSENMCMLTYPDTVSKLEDAIDMIEYSLHKSKKIGGGTVIYADKDILEKGRREHDVLNAISNAIRDCTFDVYYQPIYSVELGRYTKAEALVRLIDDRLGFISPEEFIPLAEKNGLIIQIGEQVLDKICSFYKENNLMEMGISSIHFNLSVVECMQDKLKDNIIDLLDKYQLPYNCIGLEITERAAVASAEALKSNMDQLIAKGMRFSMDDYGTGFSNTATIINYPFSEIKIDKSIVWSAMEDEKAMIAFKYSVAMMKELKLKIVAEGVETEEQAELLKKMGCDFFQGYYYSKPLRDEEFLQVIS